MANITSLVTAQWLKDRYLVGVDLTDDNNNPFPDAVFTGQIAAAISELETMLDVVIDPVTVTNEKHDYTAGVFDAPNYAPLMLHKRPVRAISGVTCQWGQNAAFTLPESWLNMSGSTPDFSGQLTIIPTSSTVSTLSSYGLPWGYRDVATLWYRVTYTAGYADPSTEIDPLMLDAIGLRASMLALDIAGNLIAGAGIANKSVSLDSLSTSIGTTSSATNSGYGSTIISYRDRLKVILPILKAKYLRINMAIL